MVDGNELLLFYALACCSWKLKQVSKSSSLLPNSSRFETELTRKNGIKSSTSSELQYGSFKLNLKKDVIVCRVTAGNVWRLPTQLMGHMKDLTRPGPQSGISLRYSSLFVIVFNWNVNVFRQMNQLPPFYFHEMKRKQVCFADKSNNLNITV